MSRINTNIASLTAQRVLGQNNKSLGTALERLSTGLRINRGKDDPAGLIASENLRSDLSSLNAAVTNSERADQVVNIAEGGLQEISSLLTELQGLLTASASSAGLSGEEKEANQLQIDSILQTVDRISGSSSFQGIKLLNGNFDYKTTAVDSGVTDFQVNGAKFESSTLDVDAIVTQSAQKAGLFVELGANATGTAGEISLGDTGGTFTIEITGTEGSRELSFSSNQTLGQVAAAINSFTEVTGVEAAVSGTGVTLSSSTFGSEAFTSVKINDDAGIVDNGSGNSLGVYALTAGDFTAATGTATTFSSSAASNGISDEGQDIAGTINGIVATGNGKEMSINTDFLDVAFTLDDTTSQTLGAVSAMTITGGGADFQLAGDVNIAGKVSLGIGDISTRKLGNSDVGYLDDLSKGKAFNVVTGDDAALSTAQKIVDAAVKNVSSTRGRLGAFQKNVVGATIRSLGITIENTTAAESVIRDADFAKETASLTRNQILVQASTSSLAQANQQPQNVLSLLG
ncbi:MAG: flagellin [Phycisphaerales bacterium]|jgi:flagellin